ncbi:MAG: phosphoenolpyruvate--protein phosphotransferase [Actinomycetota bacterium]
MAERVLVGAGVGAGVAIGTTFYMPAAVYHIEKRANMQTSGRVMFSTARAAVASVVAELEAEAIEQQGDAQAILFALAGILEDTELLRVLKDFFAEGAGPEAAIRGAFGAFGRKLLALGGYFAERANDLEDLAERVIRQLGGVLETVDLPRWPFILITENLSPMVAAKLDPNLCQGVITAIGSATSHAAIILKSAAVPVVAGVHDATSIANGTRVVLDASSGQIFVKPDATEIERYSLVAEANTSAIAILNEQAMKPLPVHIMANLGSSTESAFANSVGADGVGLLRTELLFLGAEKPPTLQDQMFEYSKILARFAGKTVIARLLDVDIDKPLPFLQNAGEGKYAGRGLTSLLANPEILEAQLKALAQAQAYYPRTELWIMAPMVTCAAQARAFLDFANRLGLGQGGSTVKLGVMIEVPEILVEAELSLTLKMCDFVSIGTNDLTHYILQDYKPIQRDVSHRPNQSIARRTLNVDADSPYEALIFGQVKRVIDAAKPLNKPVGVCGELASDARAALQFIKWGVDSLSVAPVLIAPLRAALSSSL